MMLAILPKVAFMVTWLYGLTTCRSREDRIYLISTGMLFVLLWRASWLCRVESSAGRLEQLLLAIAVARVGCFVLRRFALGQAQRCTSGILLATCVGGYALLASTLFTETGYQYRGAFRLAGWMGDPNLFGNALVQAIIAAGTLATMQPRANHRRVFTFDHRIAVLSLPLFAGLISSYSRGAWLALLMGGVVWIVDWAASRPAAATSWPALRRKWRVGDTLMWLCSASSLVFVLCTWLLRDSQITVVRRLFSVGNLADLSWRNRLSTWGAQLDVLKDYPLLGIGWENRLSIFRFYYLPPHLDSPAAFDTNDFLGLAASLGIFGLLAFAAIIGAPFLQTRAWRGSTVSNEEYQVRILRRGLRSMLTALGVGFFLNGLVFNFYFALLLMLTVEMLLWLKSHEPIFPK